MGIDMRIIGVKQSV